MPTKNEELTTAAQADLAVINQMHQSSQESNNIVELDEEYKNIFEHFINYLLSHNIKVIFYFPPLEPMAYSELVEKNPNYKTVKIAEKYFKDLAAKYNLKMIGSYAPGVIARHSTSIFFKDRSFLFDSKNLLPKFN